MVKFTSHSCSSCARLGKLFLLLGTILLLAPAAGVFASSPSNEEIDISGNWEITIHDPGGWLAEGMANGKYWQTAETWETKNGEPIMKPQDYEYSLDLIAAENAISGTYQWKLAGESGFTKSSDDIGNLFKNDSLSGELSGTIQGNQITLKMKTFAELSGTVTGTSMQGSGTLLHHRIVLNETDYTDIPDRPVTFSGTLAEAAGSDCQAIVTLPKDLKPGDDLSPTVVFKPLKGNEKITPLSQQWFFNGKEANSIVWDGQYVEIELQYTCPNHMPHSEILDFLAYKDPTATQLSPTETPETAAMIKPDDEQKNDSQVEGKNKPEEQTEGESSTTDLEAVGTVAVVAGGALTVISGAVGGGLVINNIVKSAKDAETVAKKVTAKPASKQTSPTAQRERLTPQEKSALREKIRQLEQENVKIMREQENLRVAQKTIFQCKEKLARTYKKNLLKKSIIVMVKTADTVSILINPAKTAVQTTKATLETAITYIEGAWDAAVKAPPKGASDGEILQNQRENLDRLNNEVEKLRQKRNLNKDERYRNEHEIEEIKRRIADAIEVPFK
jgi:uncharacterized membrane protein